MVNYDIRAEDGFILGQPRACEISLDTFVHF